jgi:hypothetical protein
MVSKAGRYGAKLAAWTVEETQGGLPCFTVKFQIVAVWTGSDWQAEANEITGYFYPVKKDGAPNDTTIEMLMKVLKWDGKSFLSLHEGAHGEVKCQLEVKEETYEGKRKLRVAWLYPASYAGHVIERKSAAAVKGIDAKWSRCLGAAAPAAAGAAPAVNEPGAEDIPF